MMAEAQAEEAVARALCIAEGGNPDMLVHFGQPLFVKGGFAAFGEMRLLWTHYLPLAKAAIDAIEQLPAEYLERLAA